MVLGLENQSRGVVCGLDYAQCSFVVLGMSVCKGEEVHCMTAWLGTFLTSATEVFAPEVAVWALFVGSAQNELGFPKVKFI